MAVGLGVGRRDRTLEGGRVVVFSVPARTEVANVQERGGPLAGTVRGTDFSMEKRDGEAGWTKCFEYPRSIDYQVHTYISSGGANARRRAVFINSIKFYDNEDVIEGEAE